MKNKRSLIFCSSAFAVIAAFSVGLTIAFLGNSDSETNTLCIDSGDVSINESFNTPSTQTLNNIVDKDVRVENLSKTDCYVRVYVDFSDSYVRDKAMLSNSANAADDTYLSFYDYRTALAAASNTVAEGWVYRSDNNAMGGYFYYTAPVKAGESTPSLFRHVKTAYGKTYDANSVLVDEPYLNNASAEDFITDFGIIVYSESVQTVDDGVTVGWEKAWKEFLRVS